VTAGRHQSLASGTEYTYTFSVRPGGKEIWTAQVFREHRLVATLARGLADPELPAGVVIEHVRRMVEDHIELLR
jgi:hypothetical protein